MDDDEAIREILEMSFNRAGINAVLAESAENALEILKGEDIQVMFFDIMLPGMSGIELSRMIRKDRPDSFLVAMTGYSKEFEYGMCKEAGFDDYFIKPVSPQLLINVANNAFQSFEKSD